MSDSPFKEGQVVYHPIYGRGILVHFHKVTAGLANVRFTKRFGYRAVQLVSLSATRVSKSWQQAVNLNYPLFEGSEANKGKKFDEASITAALLAWFSDYVAYHGKIIITAAPNVGVQTATEIGAVMGISPREAAKYVAIQSDASHGAKFDIVFPNGADLRGFDEALGLFFNPRGKMCSEGIEIQVGSRGLAEHLMSQRSMVPQEAIAKRRPVIEEIPIMAQVPTQGAHALA